MTATNPARSKLEGWAAPALRPVNRIFAAVDAERGHWFVWVPVLFGIGISTYFSLPAEPSFAVTLALLFAGSALAFLARAGSGLTPALALCLCISAFGFAAAKARTEFVRAPVLSKPLYRAVVNGTVERIEPRPDRGQRLTIRVSKIEGLAANQTPAKVRIRAMSPLANLNPGEPIRIRANLTPPPEPALPGGYDFGRTAWYLGIGATGYTLAKPERIEGPPPGITARLASYRERLRQTMAERIKETVPGETGAIATALITGERGGISEETTEAFRDSGLVHILSISGLHMVIMAGTLYAALRIIFAAFPAIALRYPTKKWAALMACVAALAYLLISGAATATVRAYIMVTIMLLAVILDRPALSMRNVAWAALLILIVSPEALLDAGFQMSFAAVVALISAYEALRERQTPPKGQPSLFGQISFFLAGILLTTVVASIAVAPISAYHFHQSQQLALIANIIAVPICNFVVMPAALMTMLTMPVGLEEFPLTIMAWGIDGLTATAKWVAGLPGAVSHIPEYSTHAFGCVIAGGLWLTLWRARWRAAGLGLIAVGLGLSVDVERRHIIVGQRGDVVAVRQNDGRLAITPGRGHNYKISRWLEHDGDHRSPNAARENRAYRCDRTGCLTQTTEQTIAIARHGSALRDDCKSATVLIATERIRRPCTRPQLIIDYQDLRTKGTHAVFIDPNESGNFRVETVRDRRGDRPWVGPFPQYKPTQKRTRSPQKKKPAKFMSPSGSVIPQKHADPINTR